MIDRATEDRPRRPATIVATVALATISTTFPGLASGSLAVQASDDLGVSEGAWGYTLSAFFLASACTSVHLGRLAQRIGPRRQLIAATLSSAVLQLLIATLAGSFLSVVLLLAAAGAVNAGAQTAVNLALARAELPRLGAAIATKQSAMPASAMLGGLAVPTLALTLGWRWAYVAGSIVALVAFIGVLLVIAPDPAERRSASRAVGSTSRALMGAAFASFLLAYTAGALNAWTVASGVDAGLDEGVAGLALSAAAAVGIAMRLIVGSRIDRSDEPPLRGAARSLCIGIVGFALLAMRVPLLHVLAGFLAFGGGWIWPTFTNFAIINANAETAGRATGMTQTGVYLGVMAAPATTGPIVDRAGYPLMWAVVAVVGVLAAGVLMVLSPHFARPPAP